MSDSQLLAEAIGLLRLWSTSPYFINADDQRSRDHATEVFLQEVESRVACEHKDFEEIDIVAETVRWCKECGALGYRMIIEWRWAEPGETEANS